MITMGRIGGLLLVLLIIGVIGYLMYLGEQQLKTQELITKPIETSREFSDGEVISFVTLPIYDKIIDTRNNAQKAFDNFYENNDTHGIADLLVADRYALQVEIKNFLLSTGLGENEVEKFIGSLDRNELTQEQILSMKQNLTPEEKNELQVLLNKDDSKKAEIENVLKFGITGANVTSIHYVGLKQVSVEESQNGMNIVYRGDIAKVVGKIVKNSSPPYFYNVNVQCCDGQDIRQASNRSTEPDGTFVFEFSTNSNSPLGDYVVTIITTNTASTELLEYYYYFRLVQ